MSAELADYERLTDFVLSGEVTSAALTVEQRRAVHLVVLARAIGWPLEIRMEGGVRQLTWKKRRAVIAAAALLVCGVCTLAAAQPIIIDHTSVAAYEQLTAADVQVIQNSPFLVVDRSVGSSIFSGYSGGSAYALGCLQVPYASAPSACKRILSPYRLADGTSPYDNAPETWSVLIPNPPVTFFGQGVPPALPCPTQTGSESAKWLGCFEAYVNANAATLKGVMLWPSYLESYVVVADYIAMNKRIRQTYPHLTVVLATTSLARAAAPWAVPFNEAIRNAAMADAFPLYDAADLESHTQAGTPTFDSSDGVFYANGTTGCTENLPNDGFDYPAIAQQYTAECTGGHPGNPDVGKIRLGKAWHVLVARLGSVPPPPPPPATFSMSQPSNITQVSADGQPVVVTYALPTLSGGVLPYTGPTCTPASGTTFPVGVTTVFCTASDATSTELLVSFSVTVTYTAPPPQPATLFLSPGDCRVILMTPVDWMLSCSAVVASTVADGTAVITLRATDGSTDTRTIPVVKIP